MIQALLVEEFQDQLYKDPGGTSLCSFSSSAHSVKCAVAIQNKLIQWMGISIPFTPFHSLQIAI